MQELVLILPTVTLALALLMAGLWAHAFAVLDFKRWLPVLRGLAPVLTLSAAAWATLAPTQQQRWVALSTLVLPFLFYCIQLVSKQPERKTVEVGEPIRNFNAVDGTGSSFDLSSLRGQPFILKFYRGHWCPYCRLELKAWNEMAPELEARGIQFVAISPDTEEELTTFAKAHTDYAMRFLCDPELRVTDLYNLRSHKTLAMGMGRSIKRQLAVPTTILVDGNGIVRWVDQSTDHQVRSNPKRVLPELDQLRRTEPELAA